MPTATTPPGATPAATAWQADRGRLFGIAYRMLGDAGEAEDVVSEVALQAIVAERGVTKVQSWPAWLTTTCVRRSVDRLRSLQTRREEYPGTWLPEPVSDDRLPEEVVATRELLSVALLHLAEQLTPTERAALVLHRAFAMTGPEIAEILASTPAAVRQMVSRAHRKLKIEPDQRLATAADQQALGRLLRAVERADITEVLALLEDGAVLHADGGGKVSAARRPVIGAQRIARFLLGIMEKAAQAGDSFEVGVVAVNGEVGVDFRRPGRRDVVVCEWGPSGRVVAIRMIANPDKLSRV